MAEGEVENFGLAPAAGFNVNVAWNSNSGEKNDSDYCFAFHKIVLPLANEFRPDFVIVSAGFDGAAGDPLGRCNLSPAVYAYMTYMLQTVANGQLVLLLEGGYNIDALKECSTACALVLAGISPVRLPNFAEVQRDTVEVVARVADLHRKFWNCFRYANLPNFVVEKAQPPVRPSDHPAASPDLPPSVRPPDHLAASPDHPAGLPRDRSAGSSAATANAAAEFLALPVGEIPQGLQMFAVVPLPECPHLDAVREIPAGGLNANDPCLKCGNVGENWVCLTCFQVHCGRYVQEHGIDHWNCNRSHSMVLSYADLSIWCYECEAYVHNEILLPAKRAAHRSKFGADIPEGPQ